MLHRSCACCGCVLARTGSGGVDTVLLQPAEERSVGLGWTEPATIVQQPLCSRAERADGPWASVTGAVPPLLLYQPCALQLSLRSCRVTAQPTVGSTSAVNPDCAERERERESAAAGRIGQSGSGENWSSQSAGRAWFFSQR